MELEQLSGLIESEGFALLKSVYSPSQSVEMLNEIESAFSSRQADSSLRTSRQTVFAARNLIDIIPNLNEFWQVTSITDLLLQVLGEQFGLVRVLYFDKPSHRSWTLPWHKDMTIAVKNNQLGGRQFCKPTTKAGIPHVEGSESVLQNMLTLRIHLDDVTEDNGPLQVIPRSHWTGKEVEPSVSSSVKVLASAGDVLAMRPLISHSSGHSNPEKEMHRRILHLEFSGQKELPDGYQWQWFESMG